ncbi:MAG: DUF1822 family protein [Phormidesmis sp.]
MTHPTQQELTLPVPLTLSAHHSAQKFYQQHLDPRKAKQIYLNTLAVEAVHTYLGWVGVISDRQASDSWDPVIQALTDVADLEIPDQGRLECCPVLPESTTCYIPPESSGERIGYLPVLFDAALETATLLGFAASENVAENVKELSLTCLEPLTSLFDYLKPQPALTTQKRTALSQWLQGTVESGWKTVEELLSPQPVFNFRQSDLATPEELAGTTVRGKLLELTPAAASRKAATTETALPYQQSREIQNTDTLAVTQAAGERVVFLVGIAPYEEHQSNVWIKLCPVEGERFLPEDLEVRIRDNQDMVVMEAQSRQTDMLQLNFRGVLNEQFTTEVALNGVSLVEKFVV